MQVDTLNTLLTTFDMDHLGDILIQNGLCDTEHMPYEMYLRTPQWKTTRRLKLEQAGHKCQVCAGKNRLQVHHNSYIRRGRERLDDLAVLCDECHERNEPFCHGRGGK